MNYEEMRDFEINSLVFRLMMKYEPMHCHGGFIYHPIIGGEYNPCNNPADAWPIILETCMTIELADPNLGGIGTNTIYNPRGTDWQCDYTDNSQCFRAAMICFLEMKDEQDA